MYFIYLLFFSLFFLQQNIIFQMRIKKNSYRSFQSIDKKNDAFTANLSILESDTENIIEYIESNVGQNKKTYHFWKLLIND